MKEFKYTPGPWEWSTSNSWRRLSAGGKDGNVMYPRRDRHDGHENLEFPNGGFEGPDARLIAAAPDLYEALRKAEQLASVASDWNLDEVEIDEKMTDIYDLIREFRAALAKAVPND